MIDLQDILARIEQRLIETGQKATPASIAAGKRDAIRNLERSILKGKGSPTLETIDALAHQLGVTSKWLLFGDGEKTSNELDLNALLAAVAGSYEMLGFDKKKSSEILKLVIEVAQEPPIPSAGDDFHRVQAQLEVRRFLKSKDFQGDGA